MFKILSTALSMITLLFQAGLDRSILLNFIQLRSDYKTQKLAISLKGLATWKLQCSSISGLFVFLCVEDGGKLMHQ